MENTRNHPLTMSTYPADGSEFERGAWALCTGIDAAIVVFGGLFAVIILVRLIIEAIPIIKEMRKP